MRKKHFKETGRKYFQKTSFLTLTRERLSVLYSDKGSRPHTPINVIFGSEIIKMLFDYSDDEMADNLMLDPCFQLALHTTSFEEQPLGDKSLSKLRFNCRTLSRIDYK